MKITVNITKKVLQESMYCGIKTALTYANYAGNCAIAVALKEFFPYVMVRPGYATVRNEYDHIIDHIVLPKEAEVFIGVFDSYHDKKDYKGRLNLPEMSFELELSNTLIEHIGISEVYKVMSESRTLTLASI